MASDKQRRKAAKAKQQPAAKPGPFRHPDGDRRHRGSGMTAKEGIKNKELLRLIGAVELPPEEDHQDESPSPVKPS